MSDLFVGVYSFLSNRKKLFFLLTAIFFFGLLFLASRITFEEDISKSINNQSRPDMAGFVLKNMTITDKLIINISNTDTTKPPDPDQLVEIGQNLVDSLNEFISANLIRSIAFKASDTVIMAMMNLVQSYLPVFLEESDYRIIDSLIQPTNITRALEKDFRILVSPASMVLKKRIQADPLGISNPGLAKLKSLQAGGSFEIYDGWVFSSDMRHLLIFLVPSCPSNETSRNDKLITSIDQVINDLKSAGNSTVQIRYFGGTAVAVANARQIKQDIFVTLIVSILLIFLLIGWYFKSIRVPLIGFLPAIFGAVFALSLLYLFKGTISAISLGIGSVILGLIIDYSLYLINHYRKCGNIEQALRELSTTIVVCGLTTMGAFLCLIFLNSPVLQDLGWFAALSVAGAALFTLFIQPHLFGNKLAIEGNAIRPTFIDQLAGIRYEEKKWLIAVISIMIVVGIFYADKVEFETNMAALSFVTPDLSKAETDLDRISNYKLKKLYLVSNGKTIEQALVNKEKLSSKIQDLISKGVIHSKNDAGYLLGSDSLQLLKISRWNQYWTSEKKSLLRKLIEMEGKRVGFSSGAFDGFFQMIDQAHHPIPVNIVREQAGPLVDDWLTVTRERVLAPVILQVSETNKNLVYQAFPGDDSYILFDKQSLTNRFIENVKQDFELLVTLSMAFVTLLLIFSLGRLGLGLITALPMFISWYITLGFMGLTGIRFNIFNIIISSFIFGLGVDYSILIMRGLQNQLISGTNDLKSFKIGVLLSSLTTLFGVGALFLARHPAIHSIALVSMLGVGSVVLVSFVFLPLIFNQIILSRAKNHKFPVTLRILIKTLVTWGNIVAIAIILMIVGVFIRFLVPVSRKCKEKLFHYLFYWLTRAYIAFTFAFDRKLINEPGESFSKPAIIISNHQSLIETPAFLRLYPKILILSTNWVYKSLVFGPIARLANFFNVDDGLENIIGLLKVKISEGYSVLIFPEGHRSDDHHIQRFHRGAFYLSEQLQVDILPIVVFGTGDFLGRGAFWGRPNSFIMKILDRVPHDDGRFGSTYQEKSRQFRQYYIQQYSKLKREEGTVHYYRRKLALNYVLKGPVLEWYMRVKLKLENNYELYDQLIPRRGEILDLGCGYGFMAYMLMFTADERKLTGVDYDPRKIDLANHCFSKNDRINFICDDVSAIQITPQDGYILSDVLHYLTPEKQDELLRRCFSNLRSEGVILIREANAELKDRHRKSVLTEIFSTRSGFNKTSTRERKLYFTSAQKIAAISNEYNLTFQVVDNKKITSNNLFIIRRQSNG